MNALLQADDSLVVVLDGQGRIVLFNAKCQETTGYSEEQVKGRVLWEFLVPEAVAQEAKSVFSIPRTPAPIEQAIHAIPWIDATGQEHLIAWRKTLVRDSSRHCQYLVASGTNASTNHDSTARALQLQQALDQIRQQLQHALHIQEQMIQNVSHELRSPLTLILGYAEALENGIWGTLTAEQHQAASAILRQGQQLQRMIERLLTLQSLETYQIQRVPVALDMLVELSLQKWQQQAAEHHARLIFDVASPVPRFLGDAHLLTQMLDDLLDNALKFGLPPGQRDEANDLNARTIRIRVWATGSWLYLAVSDSGMGIPHDELERVFDRFYQIDGGLSRSRGGMGIGLTLCRSIVNAHGGTIKAESSGPDQGATFTVTLPLKTNGCAPAHRLSL